MLELAGVQDVLTKCQGTSNPHNVVKATMNGLRSLIDAYGMAEHRGMSVQEVFNGSPAVDAGE